MRRMFLFLVMLSFAVGVFGQELDYGKLYFPKSGMSADEIMRIKYHNKYSLFAQDYLLPETEILYVDKTGFTRTKKALRKRMVKAGEDGISYKDLVLITYPTQGKGLAVLTWTYEDTERDQDVWLWIPSLKKVRKISASEDDDSFLGSDFTVEEVSTRGFQDEAYELVGEKTFDGYTFEHTGEVKFEGTPCFVIECTPRKAHWYYSKRIVWIDKETGGNIFEEYYDKRGELFKTLFREWVWYKPESKRYPKQDRLECKDLRTGHRTVILNGPSHYDQGIDEQEFTVRKLLRSKW